MASIKTKFKIFFLVQYGALGVWGPYIPVLLNKKGFSGIQIGLLMGTMPIVLMVFQPVWSFLSDLLHTRRGMLLISSLGMGIAVLGVGWAESFGFAFMWAILFAALWAPLEPIGTAMLLETLEESGEQDKFSLIRLWGSIGFGLTSLLVGILFFDQIMNFLMLLAGGMYFVLGLVSQWLPEKRVVMPTAEVKSRQVLSGNPALVLFLLGSVFIGATFGVYNNYQTLFLQSLNAQDWLIGLSVSLQAFVEVPLMLLVPLLLQHRSPRWIILAGAWLLPIQWVIYYLIQKPGWIAPSQVIHGVGVISFLVVGVGFVDQLISPRWRATGQGLYATAFTGVGPAFGVYLAGMVFEWFEIRSVWALSIVLGVIGLVFLLFAIKRAQGHAKAAPLPGLNVDQ